MFVIVNNFVMLVCNYFYDGLCFYCVIDGFMVQIGDFKSVDDVQKDVWGLGGFGYQFFDEVCFKLMFDIGG